MIEYIIAFIFGFAAELIDGMLGMGYGVTLNSLLLSLGLTPAYASAAVHTSEVFTTLASGVSHLKFGNIDKKLFVNLMVPGTLFAVLGAYILVNFPSGLLRKLVSLYLLFMGGIVILRAFGKNIFFKRVNAKILAAIGGLLDAMGGGGWGPIVTSTLIAGGNDPKKTVGSVNLAEFFVTISQILTFIALIGLVSPMLILALIPGGIVAAIISSYLCSKMPTKTLMILVGALILTVNLRNLFL
ncbi:MAG: sulfite exporter TauE/SafE family protein [Thermoproteota archaeon]